ncbi:VWA domain-containing protein [uncultured Modestobacter sp.]|uniref:VWA domain-containing protein n=1 Tax=uncultured Modestobacter sp. TaxID=380048 RepID=UPI00262EF027|nr:VWA domain-containing protein [uncultured Modestobacter sp.]
MGRHAHTRAHARARTRTPGRRPALLAGLSALLVAAVVAALVWWVSGRDGSTAEAAECADRETVRVTVAPELGELAGQLLADPLPLGGSSCAVAEVTATEPLQTLAALGSLDAAALPQVWVPDSSLWTARAGSTELEAAGSLATSPLVLATSRAAADELGWTTTPPTWGEALGTGRPLAVPDLAASAEGLSVLAAVRQSLGGDEDADNAVVQAVLAAGRGDVPTVADALAAGTDGGADAPLVPVSEQEVLTTNQAAGSDSLVAVYPSDGSPALDYPVIRVGAPEDTAAVDAVVSALTADSAAAEARAAGFRDQEGTAPEGAGAGTGVQEAAPEQLQLDPAALQALLGRLSSLATPSRLLTVIDVSTSMNAPAGNGTRATLARDATKSALTLLPDSYSGGVWAFAYQLDGDRDWVELAPLRTFGADAGGQTHRELIDQQFDTLPSLLSPGGTGLYDTTLAAVRAAREAYDPNAVNSVVLITDGDNDDDEAGVQLEQLLSTLRAEADPARPVKVIGIALGPDADLGALEQIGEATGGAAYQALDPEDLQGVLFDAIRRRS